MSPLIHERPTKFVSDAIKLGFSTIPVMLNQERRHPQRSLRTVSYGLLGSGYELDLSKSLLTFIPPFALSQCDSTHQRYLAK